MIAALLAAAAISASCDLETPSGTPGCTRDAVDALPMNRIQTVGTHNSYKMAIAPNEMAILRTVNPNAAVTLDYAHAPLARQLDAGARQLEIDVVSDPAGGLYANPLGYRMAGAAAAPYDFTPLKGPGLKVIHVPDVDYRSTCATFVACLGEVRAWSRAHPAHLPILILLNLKEEGVKLPGAVKPPPFDAAAMDGLDAEIRSVFAESELITPDQVQGARRTLRDAVTADGWPSIENARGKVMFACDCTPEQVARYRGSRRSLEGRVAFVNTDETSPAAGYITLNDPKVQAARILAAVRAGLIVRTRADADTHEARAGDTSRRDAAFTSGAQYISTDYMKPEARFGNYTVVTPTGGVARISPAAPGR